LHQSRLVEHLQGLNPNYTDFMNQASQLNHVQPGSVTALAHSYQLATTQSLLLSYLDAFKALAVIFLLLLPLLALVKAGPAGGKAESAA
jgi:DHA2 family multidrug resistance protein